MTFGALSARRSPKVIAISAEYFSGVFKIVACCIHDAKKKLHDFERVLIKIFDFLIKFIVRWHVASVDLIVC